MKLRTRLIYASVIPLFAVGTTIAVTSPVSAATTGPTLNVDLTANRHAISPDIYGMNFADENLATELRLPVRRWGGNATTRYNYALDETNRGADWYFENVPGNADPATLPDGSETDVFVEQDRRTGTNSILTVPLIGWVPKARDYSCGFSISKYGAQEKNDSQWRPDCGNGVAPDGSFITGNDPRDTSVEAGAEYVTNWLGHLTGKYGTAENGGVKYYNLDNEPDIWHSTHRDVHPAGASYEEIRAQTYAIAAAVKAADPGAKTLGPVGWGWNSLSLSGLDQETCNRLGGSCWSSPPDSTAHGGVGFGAWYLAQMRAYQETHGVRILDYYDNHWYPQGSGVFGDSTDEATSALRLRSTRNLWDPQYVDESWINQATQLIPRMKQMVADNYPGTKTAITEYNWGALNTVNGALAQADVLGIFGREGLDLATLWDPPSADQPGAYAFRMFRNYDGQGSAFGDTSVKATSGDQDKLSVYAATGAGNAVTIVVVNKTGEDLTSNLRVNNGLAPPSKTHVYTYGAADPSAIVEQPSPVIAAPPIGVGVPTYFTTSLTFPANSITTFATTVPLTDVFPPTAPGAPAVTGMSATGFTLNWSAATDPNGIAGYQVRVAGAGIDKTIDLGNVTSYTVTGLAPDNTYTVDVRAKDPAGNWSPYSTPLTVTIAPGDDTAPPTAPGKPSVSGVGGGGFTATWAASTDDVGVTGYEVWLVQGDTRTRVATTDGDTTTYPVTGLQPATTYAVSIRALDAAGNVSEYSGSTSLTTLPKSSPCAAVYQNVAEWSNGFVGEVTVRNTGTETLGGWMVTMTFANGQTVTQLWNGTWKQAGAVVTVGNVAWNGTIPPSGSQRFGFLGSRGADTAAPVLTCTAG